VPDETPPSITNESRSVVVKGQGLSDRVLPGPLFGKRHAESQSEHSGRTVNAFLTGGAKWHVFLLRKNRGSFRNTSAATY
jgi:hypothetical protein